MCNAKFYSLVRKPDQFHNHAAHNNTRAAFGFGGQTIDEREGSAAFMGLTPLWCLWVSVLQIRHS